MLITNILRLFAKIADWYFCSHRFGPLTHIVPSRKTSRSNTWTRRCDIGSVRAVSSTRNAERSGDGHLLFPMTQCGAAEGAVVEG